jgi:hypothetical protein
MSLPSAAVRFVVLNDAPLGEVVDDDLLEAPRSPAASPI